MAGQSSPARSQCVPAVPAVPAVPGVPPVAAVPAVAARLAGAEAWPLSTEPVLEIGGGSGPEAALYRVTDVALLPDGRVAVGMNPPAQVLVFGEVGAPPPRAP